MKLFEACGKVATITRKIEHSTIFHALHGVCHLGYLAFVFLEHHGLYSAMGGMLFICTLFNTLHRES